ncbi:MAG: hypothetical protein R3320_12530, partial [Nitriliruptorales bacterium]|nr:hypothetical protein [Nitriliruptorales bacterium]
MNRKRLISILTATALSVAAFAGPAVALEGTDLQVEEETVTAEVDGVTATLEADEDPSVEVESDQGSLTVDSGDQTEPVKTETEDDGSTDPVEELGGEVDKALSGDDESSPEPSSQPAQEDDDVKAAGGDTTAAPRPALSAFDHAPRRASLGSNSYRHFSYTSYQRPAPAASAHREVSGGEPPPVVA